jgi:hypothetical protein
MSIANTGLPRLGFCIHWRPRRNGQLALSASVALHQALDDLQMLRPCQKLLTLIQRTIVLIDIRRLANG